MELINKNSKANKSKKLKSTHSSNLVVPFHSGGWYNKVTIKTTEKEKQNEHRQNLCRIHRKGVRS